MAKVPFTAGRVSAFNCPPEKKQAFLWDATAPGLGLRTTPAGKPAYVFQSVYQGKDLRLTIGSPAAWTIPHAQAKARELQRLIDEGKDPRDLKREALAASAAKQAEATAKALTVGEVWPLYLANGKPKRKDAWKPGYRADLEAMAAPGGLDKKRGKGVTRPGPLYPLLALPLSDVNEDSLKIWFDSEAVKGKHQATRALMMFRGFLRWCSARPEYRKLTDRDAGRAAAIVERLPSNTRRTDALEAAQVSGWWAGVEQLSNRTASVYLRALLLTGARREELAAMKWADVDFQWRKLTIADKVEDTRTIPLTPHLAQLLATLPRINEFVFASTGKSGRIADTRASHAKALQSASIDGLTIHGLRRSFSLLGEAAGAPAGAIAQVMGHKPSATAEGYRPRSVDALRPFLTLIEVHTLKLAGVQFDPEAEPGRLHVVGS
ncbi:integrase family protein [Hydrogenophaga sp. IBVHS1]|uniref:tyrosine-type recombinase/integrase n=1 Tax=unclassified Hydrogenophaga TaxID=2610897 RepID=UPI000A2D2BCD|nr:integrase family protein [Hydrogenophaga sp. IBVHS1]OSZ74605.1 integrase [Hydrogenophaga sp. IBVHS1]